MRDEDAFLQGLLANPADDALRSISADWLEERRDAWAAFLRLHLTLARLRNEDPRSTAVQTELQGLRLALSPDWLAVVD
jgi:uncharacterized protein (TIGR02996 family)